ncbi:MAG: ISNCY family transposase [Polaribacter sp.]
MELGVLPILETPVLEKSRDDVPALIKTLLEIYKTPEYADKIFEFLEKKISKDKKKTGRKGLTLWQIFVLAQFRLGLDLDYDRLHYMVNSDSTLRQLLGIETLSGFKKIEIDYQRILDNLHLLDDVTMQQINEVVVNFGHKEVFKKKETEALRLKTDSFVVESNVHFPTDYTLLWDSMRKALDCVNYFKNKYDIENWRKLKDWYRSLKNLSRAMGTISGKGGKNKAARLKSCTEDYLKKARVFREKLVKDKDNFPEKDILDILKKLALEDFIVLVDKHIDLVDRRILQGEEIPHQEKLFSIFEQYTEWIHKGKKRPSVELGKKVSITTDQYGLIIDSYLMEKEADSQIVVSTAKRILEKFKVTSWSFDKGYWHKDNKAFLQSKILQVIMPKKGKPNKIEQAEQSTKEFKKLRNKHSAVESNINELEHSGLDRCPDRGLPAFKRYVGTAIVAYNLKRIGREMLAQERIKEKKQKQKQAA